MSTLAALLWRRRRRRRQRVDDLGDDGVVARLRADLRVVFVRVAENAPFAVESRAVARAADSRSMLGGRGAARRAARARRAPRARGPSCARSPTSSASRRRIAYVGGGFSASDGFAPADAQPLVVRVLDRDDLSMAVFLCYAFPFWDAAAAHAARSLAFSRSERRCSCLTWQRGR